MAPGARISGKEANHRRTTWFRSTLPVGKNALQLREFSTIRRPPAWSRIPHSSWRWGDAPPHRTPCIAAADVCRSRNRNGLQDNIQHRRRSRWAILWSCCALHSDQIHFDQDDIASSPAVLAACSCRYRVLGFRMLPICLITVVVPPQSGRSGHSNVPGRHFLLLQAGDRAFHSCIRTTSASPLQRCTFIGCRSTIGCGRSHGCECSVLRTPGRHMGHRNSCHGSNVHHAAASPSSAAPRPAHGLPPHSGVPGCRVGMAVCRGCTSAAMR